MSRPTQTTTDLYHDLREKWRHEDELVNQRVTWLLTSQAFLFTAFGVLANLRLEQESKPDLGAQWYERLVHPTAIAETGLPIIAFFTLLYLGKAITAAFRAIAYIKVELVNHQCAGRIPIGLTVDVIPHATIDGAAAPSRMVAGFSASWVLIYCYELARISGVPP